MGEKDLKSGNFLVYLVLINNCLLSTFAITEQYSRQHSIIIMTNRQPVPASMKALRLVEVCVKYVEEITGS